MNINKRNNKYKYIIKKDNKKWINKNNEYNNEYKNII